MQRTAGLALGQRGIGGPGASARPVRIEPDDGVELRIESVDPRQEVVEQLEASDPFHADGLGQCLGRHEVQRGHRRSSPENDLDAGAYGRPSALPISLREKRRGP